MKKKAGNAERVPLLRRRSSLTALRLAASVGLLAIYCVGLADLGFGAQLALGASSVLFGVLAEHAREVITGGRNETGPAPAPSRTVAPNDDRQPLTGPAESSEY